MPGTSNEHANPCENHPYHLPARFLEPEQLLSQQQQYLLYLLLQAAQLFPDPAHHNLAEPTKGLRPVHLESWRYFGQTRALHQQKQQFHLYFVLQQLRTVLM